VRGLRDPLRSTALAEVDGVPRLRPVTIDGRPYVIDLSKTRRGLVPIQRQAVDQSDEPGEQSFSTEGLWRRSSSNWQGGAGQRRRDQGGDDNRFYSSHNLNPWVDGQLTVHPAPVQCYTPAGAAQHLGIPVGDYLYITDGGTLKYSLAATANPSAWTDHTGESGNTILDLVTDGRRVYVTDGTDVRLFTPGTAASSATWASTVSRLWFCNGRLLGCDDHELVELDNAGLATVVGELFNTDHRWVAAIGAPNGIYAASQGANGGAQVWYIGIDETTGALKTPVSATPWPQNELITWLDYHGRYVAICSSRGIRLAEIAAGNYLFYGSRIDVPNGVSSCAFSGALGYLATEWQHDDFLSTPGPVTSTSHFFGLWSIFLGYFTDPDNLVPAWASDINRSTALIGTPAATEVTRVVVVGDRVYFVTTSGQTDKAGVWGEGTERGLGYAGMGTAYGKLCTGTIGFGTIEDKLPVRIDAEFASDLAAAESVQIYLASESDLATFPQVEAAHGDGLRITADLLGESPSTRQALAFGFLYSDEVTAETKMSWWRYGVLPSVERVEMVELCLEVSHQVKPSEGGDGFIYDPEAEYRALKAMARLGAPVPVKIGRRTEYMRVATVLQDPENWSPDNVSLGGRITVQLLTVEV
jgi:hypothetical protein